MASGVTGAMAATTPTALMAGVVESGSYERQLRLWVVDLCLARRKGLDSVGSIRPLLCSKIQRHEAKTHQNANGHFVGPIDFLNQTF